MGAINLTDKPSLADADVVSRLVPQFVKHVRAAARQRGGCTRSAREDRNRSAATKQSGARIGSTLSRGIRRSGSAMC